MRSEAELLKGLHKAVLILEDEAAGSSVAKGVDGLALLLDPHSNYNTVLNASTGLAQASAMIDGPDSRAAHLGEAIAKLTAVIENRYDYWPGSAITDSDGGSGVTITAFRASASR
jgi:hypothetical protein